MDRSAPPGTQWAPGKPNPPTCVTSVTTPWKAIAAMSENRVIGRNNQIPWHLPEDFRWFKQATLGGTLVMGRKTFESIGRPLPGRVTVVLTRGGFSDPRIHLASGLDAIPGLALPEPVFICGGAQVYEQALPRCAELLLTRVRQEVDGDAFFPPFEHLFDLAGIVQDTPDFVIERWVRKAG